MTTILNVKVEPKIKSEAKEIVEALGFTLSSAVNSYLRDIIRTKSIWVSMYNEQPSPRLIAAMREAERDRKAGRLISFSSGEEALRYLDKIIAKKKKTKRS